MIELNEYDSRQFISTRKSKGGTLRVAGLTRVSTEHEIQLNALDNQNEWLISLVEKHDDWVFDASKDLYVDEGISGTSDKHRIQFKEMITKAKNGEYDLIVVREVCRFMRNAKLALTLVDELKRCGVEVYFVQENIHTFNQDDYFKLTIMATYAEEESKRTSERVFAGQAIARKNGVHFGNGNILGYDIVTPTKDEYRVGKKATYKINSEQAETVKLIYNLCIQGYGVAKIKSYLQKHGYETAQGNTNWHVSSIERILRRKTYTGVYEYMQSVTVDPLTHERININDRSKRLVREGNFPAIISKEVWEAAQKALDSRINHVLVDSNNVARGVKRCESPYGDLLRCGCGRKFRFDKGRKDGMGTYTCSQVKEDGSQKLRRANSLLFNDDCSIEGIIDWKLDMYSLEVFKYLRYDIASAMESAYKAIELFYNKKTVIEKKSVTVDYVKEIDKLRKQEEQILDLLLGNKIQHGVYDKKFTELEAQIKKLEESMEDDNQPTEIDEKSSETGLQAIKEYFERLKTELKITKNTKVIPIDLVKALVESIRVGANNNIEYTLRVIDKEKPNDLLLPRYEIDNSNKELLGEIEIDYDTAKAYANSIKRKVQRVHFEKPVTIKIYSNL